MGFNSGGRKKSFADINVTPLVDVMLVLLIIFMVTAPMMQQGIHVDLPKVTTSPLHTKENPLVVTMKRDGSIYIATARVDQKLLVQKLKSILRHRRDKSVYLKADKSLPYGKVVKLMGYLYRSGITSIGIITEPGKNR